MDEFEFPRPDPAMIARQDQIAAISEDPVLKLAVTQAQQAVVAFMQRGALLGLDFPTAVQMIAGACIGQACAIIVLPEASEDED